MVNLFERLDRGRPPTEESSPPIERLLDWLVSHWPKDTVTAREIYTYGPNSIRHRKTTLSLAHMLVERGWLVPTESRGRHSAGCGRLDEISTGTVIDVLFALAHRTSSENSYQLTADS